MARGQYIVRGIDWDKRNERGVPFDCADIMDYFNRAIDRVAYPLIPRKERITDEEILGIWLPTRDRTITYVAADNILSRVVCAGTIFLGPNKKTGELSITKDPDYFVHGVGTDVTRSVVADALSKGITVNIHTSVENTPMVRVMEKLEYAYSRLIPDYENYRGKIDIPNPAAYEWIVKPRDSS